MTPRSCAGWQPPPWRANALAMLVTRREASRRGARRGPGRPQGSDRSRPSSSWAVRSMSIPARGRSCSVLIVRVDQPCWSQISSQDAARTRINPSKRTSGGCWASSSACCREQRTGRCHIRCKWRDSESRRLAGPRHEARRRARRRCRRRRANPGGAGGAALAHYGKSPWSSSSRTSRHRLACS